MKVEIYIFQIVKWTYIDHMIKVSCGFKGGSLSG